jgi:hypothetical protein
MRVVQCCVGAAGAGKKKPNWRQQQVGRRVRREHRVYKYMHIYLCTTLTIRFLEVGPGRGAGLFLGVSLAYSAQAGRKASFVAAWPLRPRGNCPVCEAD